MTSEADPGTLRRQAADLVENHRQFMKRLIEMRTRHDLTQADVAERMGVSQPTVAAFERYDSNPTLATIRRYALAVGAVLDDRVLDRCQAHDAEQAKTSAPDMESGADAHVNEWMRNWVVQHRVDAPAWRTCGLVDVSWLSAAARLRFPDDLGRTFQARTLSEVEARFDAWMPTSAEPRASDE